ncbi:tetratricopeptide repeat protein [Caminibacter sp.]
MHRYEELEKLYYKKLYFKIFVFTIFIFIIAGGIFISSKKNTQKSSVKKERAEKTAITQKLKKKNEKKVVKKEIVKKNNIKKTTKNIQKLTFILPKIDNNISNNISKNNISNVQKSQSSKNKKHLNKKPETNEMNKVQPQIKIVEKSLSVKDLIKQFNNNPNYDFAMMIAKEYFKKGDLKNARIWAIKANNLNPQDVDSWLLFADILLKQNEKQKALQILKVYLNTYGDNPLIDDKIRSINE